MITLIGTVREIGSDEITLQIDLKLNLWQGDSLFMLCIINVGLLFGVNNVHRAFAKKCYIPMSNCHRSITNFIHRLLQQPVHSARAQDRDDGGRLSHARVRASGDEDEDAHAHALCEYCRVEYRLVTVGYRLVTVSN